MAFDGLMTYSIVKELQNVIIGGKIDKIFEPNNNEILLGIYQNGIKYALNIVIGSNYRLCLTTNSKANPTFAPNFCMVLRKYLLNTRITNIYSLGLERIVIIEFEGHNKSGDFTPKKLVIELMGKHSNIILLNSNDVIIDALRHLDTNSNSYRNILPSCKYITPSSEKKEFLNIKNSAEFFNIITKTFDITSLSTAISNAFTGISKSSVNHFIETLGISDVINIENCSAIYDYITNLVNNTRNVICNNKDKEYFLKISNEKTSPLQINFFVDDFCSKKELSENYNSYKTNFSKLILEHLKRLNNKLQNINNKLEECKNLDLYKIYGELITNNLYRINNIHQESITIENFYDNNNLITIPLNKEFSPSDNAKKYFKKYRKLKNAKSIVEEQKKEVTQEINYLESIIYELQIANTIEEIDEIYAEFTENTAINHIKNKKTKTHKNKNQKKNKVIKQLGEPLKYIIDGFTVLVGKNNKQNDYITKSANEGDIWFHVKDIQGSHTILKVPNNSSPSQETINKCASVAAFYSKAKESTNVSVDYTYIKYVKKPSKSKPGMVIYTNNKNVIVKPNLNIEKE